MFAIEAGSSTATRQVVALVTVVDTTVDRVVSRTFAASPIRIGGDRGSDLRLGHPQVARCHGEIWFEPGFAAFRNHAWLRPTHVDQRRLVRGEAVRLSEESVITVGPFRIDVCLCKPRLRVAERSRKVTPLVLPGLSFTDGAYSYLALETSTSAPPRAAAAASPEADWVLRSFLRLARTRASPVAPRPHDRGQGTGW